jgi:hypothetical protein
MGENLIEKVHRDMYFKDAFLGKPVKFKGSNIFGIVTFLMKDLAKITYVDKDNETKEKTIECDYAIKYLEFPGGYESEYISIGYACEIQEGTPIKIFDTERQELRCYAIFEKISRDSIWFVSTRVINNEAGLDHFAIRVDAILERKFIIESLI